MAERSPIRGWMFGVAAAVFAAVGMGAAALVFHGQALPPEIPYFEFRLLVQAGLVSDVDVGEDEVRAWTVRKGSTAPQAARAIHRDLEKGFIRAEHMKFADLISLGSEAKVKEAGKFSLKGKDYIVEDGDVLSFRAAN